MQQTLVHRGECPWGVHDQRTPRGQAHLVISRPGWGAGVGGVDAHRGAGRGRYIRGRQIGRRGEVPLTGDSVGEQVLALWVTLPAMAGFWARGSSDRWLGEGWPPAQGPRVRHLLYRQSSHPWLRQIKSWLAGSRQKWQWKRPAREEVCPPWRW